MTTETPDHIQPIEAAAPQIEAMLRLLDPSINTKSGWQNIIVE